MSYAEAPYAWAPSDPGPAQRDSLAPAFLAAVALHLALLAAVIFLHGARPVPRGDVTPITIVARGPVTDTRPAEAAPQVHEAQTEAPSPDQTAPPPPPPAPAVPVPRPPMPRPAKPTPTPKAAPAPTPKPTSKPLPTPSRPAPAAAAAPAKDDFLEHLSQSLAPSRKPPGRAHGRRGPPAPETALQARPDAGQGVSQSDLQGLQQLLERLWNPNCQAPGVEQVEVPVKFAIDGEGHVIGRVTERGDSVAARRAVDAVHQAEPYAAVYRNNVFTVNFDARKACADKAE